MILVDTSVWIDFFSSSPGAAGAELRRMILTAEPFALTGITDEDGNRFATWAYDAIGRATSSQHAGGADLTKVTYNDTDGSRNVTTALGLQLVYKLTLNQNVPKVIEIDRLPTTILGSSR